MDLTVKAEDLKACLPLVLHGKPKKPIQPAYGKIRVTASDNTITLSMSDGNLFVDAWCPAEASDEGVYLVDPDRFKALVEGTPDNTIIKLKIKKKPEEIGTLGIKQDGTLSFIAADRAQIGVWDPAEFPLMTIKDQEGWINLTRELQSTLLVPAMLDKELAVAKNVSVVQKEGYALCFVTDRTRGAIVKTTGESVPQVFLPARYLDLAFRATDADMITFHGNMVQLQGESSTASFTTEQGAALDPSRYLEGDPPVASLVIDQEILGVLKTASLFAGEGHPVDIQYLGDGELQVVALLGAEYSSRKLIATPIGDPAPFSTVMMAPFLAQALSDLGEGALCEFLEQDKVDNLWMRISKDSRTHVVMPMAIGKRKA